MARSSTRYCPQCGTPVEGEQRFCSNCGATMDVNVAHPTERASGGQRPDVQATLLPVSDPVPPPPPPESFAPSQPSSYYTPYTPGQGQGAMPASASYIPAPPSATAPAPTFARPQKDSSRGVLGQIGCGVLLIILLILGLCGGASYLGYRWISSQTTPSSTGTNTDTGSGNTQSGTPASTHIVTKQINQTITYASVVMTIQSVQQSSSFSDDSSSGSNGVVRINMKENNTAASGASFAYSETVRLILPDKSSVAPSNTLKYTSPQAQTTQTNWWDFQVPTSVSIDQLALQLGKSTEAQMQVPLTGKADLSQYQAKTIHPNTKTQYDGLNWTLTEATKSWGADGQQAAQGMRYVVVTLSIDNPSSQNFSAYYGDYIRLKSGSNMSAPTSDSTLPTSVVAGSTGKTGTLVFTMPDSSTSFTLIFEGNANTSPPISQATIDFQIA